VLVGKLVGTLVGTGTALVGNREAGRPNCRPLKIRMTIR